MEPLKRYIPIDYSKYAPDIPEDQLETYYGLPQKVQFCKECVMSNQKPNSCYEFEHTIRSKKTMVIQPDGVCDACHACHNKENHTIDWAEAGAGAARSVRPVPQNRRQLRLPGARLRRKGRYAAHLLKYKYGMHPLTVTWAPICTPLGLGQLRGLDSRRV